jgi:glucose/arabinose dehydrogenase
VRTSPRRALLVGAVFALVAACGPGGSPSPARTADVTGLRIAVETVASAFDRPILVTHAGDGSGRLYVVEQRGLVWIVDDGTRLDAPFVDISDRIVAGGERGLLGLAFHPAYPDDPRVFVKYSGQNGDEVVSSFGLAPGADAVDPASEQVLLRYADPYSNHNGGAVVFDPAGHLLIANGDGGSGGDPEDRAEDPQQLFGKILRLDISRGDGDRAYAIPSDNPHQDDEFRPEILHHGLRNPWRMSIDRGTGDLWIGDVGQGSVEEVDVARAGQGGLHFGWDTLEGSACYEPRTDCDTDGKTMPVAEYLHEEGGCTVVGGYVYRGAAHPSLTGVYFYADYCSGLVWALDAVAPGEPVQVAETDRTLSSFGEDEAGELYLTDLRTGDILRIAPAG